MKNDIYVFDMGNVILKPTDLYSMYINSKAECDYKTFKYLFYNSEDTKKVYKGLIDDNDFFQIISNKASCKSNGQELQKLYIENKSGVYDDTISYIKHLKDMKKKVCLLSNLKEIDYEYLKSVVDMEIFDEKFLSYEMGMIKPDKKIYNEVIKKIGTSNFYFFDDTEENVKEALNLGINAYQVTGESIKQKVLKNIGGIR